MTRSSMRCPHTSATSRWCSRATRSIRKNPCTKTLPSACACARSPAPRSTVGCGDAAQSLDTALRSIRGRRIWRGERPRRAARAGAGGRSPAVFLMDEPLSNLDAALRISMRAEIKHLHTAMQTTFVYVTHDQAEALTLADRIVVMKDGVIQQIGNPDEVYERPRNMFVASFLGNPAINFLEGTIARGGEGPLFRCGELEIALPAKFAAGLRDQDERAVVLGLRPEDVCAAEAAGPGLTLAGVVDSVLPVGSDRFLGLKVEGRDVFVRVDKEARHQEGVAIGLGLVAERLHLFDKASGLTLAGEGAP